MASLKTKLSATSTVEVSKQGSQGTLAPSLAFKALSEEKAKAILSGKDVDEVEQRVVELLNLTSSPKKGSIVDFYVSGMWWSRDQGFNGDQTSAFFALLQMLLDNVEKQLNLAENARCLEKHLVGIGRRVGRGGGSEAGGVGRGGGGSEAGGVGRGGGSEAGGVGRGGGGSEAGGVGRGGGSLEVGGEGAGKSAEFGCGLGDGGGLGGLQSLFNVRQATNIADYFHKSLFQHYKLYEFLLVDEHEESYVQKEVDLEVPLMSWPAPLTESVSEEIHGLYIDLMKREQGLTAEDERRMEEDAALEQLLLETISVDHIRSIIQSVYEEMAKDVEGEISALLSKRVDELNAKVQKVIQRGTSKTPQKATSRT